MKNQNYLELICEISILDLRGLYKAKTPTRRTRRFLISIMQIFLMPDLSYSNLEYTDFNNAFLKGTQLIEVSTDQTSFVKTDLSGADISGAMIKDINNAKWIIKNIKCTHIFKDGKRIDYAEGEFEKSLYSVRKFD